MTIPYPYLSHIPTYSDALDYAGQQNLNRPFMYSGGPVIDQTTYNAITWLEPSFPKPNWTEIQFFMAILQDQWSRPEAADFLFGDSYLESLVTSSGTSLSSKADKTTTVNGHALSSNVTVTKADVGLGNADNTSDLAKPVSTATQTALNAKFTTPAGATSQYVRGDGSLASFPSALDPRTSSAFTPTIVTSTSAGGTQISATKYSTTRVSVTISTTVSLAGNATGYVVAEVCPTNSTTAGDWVEVGRTPSGQSGTLVIGLTLNQSGGGQLSADLDPGYYVRYRSVNTAGTPTYAVTAGQKTIYG